MAYRLEDVEEMTNSGNMVVKKYVMEEREVWVPARPLVGPFICRLKDAWLVLVGKADAFKWPCSQ